MHSRLLTQSLTRGASWTDVRFSSAGPLTGEQVQHSAPLHTPALTRRHPIIISFYGYSTPEKTGGQHASAVARPWKNSQRVGCDGNRDMCSSVRYVHEKRRREEKIKRDNPLPTLSAVDARCAGKTRTPGPLAWKKKTTNMLPSVLRATKLLLYACKSAGEKFRKDTVANGWASRGKSKALVPRISRKVKYIWFCFQIFHSDNHWILKTFMDFGDIQFLLY